MTDVTLRMCDVYRTTKNVKRYRIRIEELNGEAAAITPPDNSSLARTCDLSQRALDRLTRFVDRGLTPPTGRKAEEGGE